MKAERAAVALMLSDLLNDVRDLTREERDLFARVVRWHHALPRYTLGHLDRVAAVEAALRKHAGVFVAAMRML